MELAAPILVNMRRKPNRGRTHMFECWDMNTWRMFETLMAASEGLPPISFLTNLVDAG